MGLPGCGALAELLPEGGQSVTPIVGAGHGQNAALIGSTNARAFRTGRISSQDREGRSGAFLPDFLRQHELRAGSGARLSQREK